MLGANDNREHEIEVRLTETQWAFICARLCGRVPTQEGAELLREAEGRLMDQILAQLRG